MAKKTSATGGWLGLLFLLLAILIFFWIITSRPAFFQGFSATF